MEKWVKFKKQQTKLLDDLIKKDGYLMTQHYNFTMGSLYGYLTSLIDCHEIMEKSVVIAIQEINDISAKYVTHIQE